MSLPSKDQLLQEYIDAHLSGNIPARDRARDEFYNIVAQELKNKDDLLGLNILAAIEESRKRGLYEASKHFNMLMSLYSAGPHVLNRFCEEVCNPIDLRIRMKALGACLGNPAL